MAVGDAGRRVAVEGAGHRLQHVRFHHHVAVDEDEVIAARIPEAYVACPGLPAIFALRQPQPGGGQVRQLRPGVIGRGVVDDDDLVRLTALAPERGEALADDPGLVVREHDRADRRHARSSISRLARGAQVPRWSSAFCAARRLLHENTPGDADSSLNFDLASFFSAATAFWL